MNRSLSELAGLLDGLAKSDGQGGEIADALTALILRKNRENAFRFLRTPYSERVVFLPQCLRATSACQAEERGSEYLCQGCGSCKIATIARRAKELGYMSVRILKGGSALAGLVAEIKPKAALGIACCIEGVWGLLACERAGVPAFCVPLLKAGCCDTDVDLDEVAGALEGLLP